MTDATILSDSAPRRASVLPALLLAAALAGCTGSIAGPDILAFDVAAERWAREGPANYVYVLRRSCFCILEAVRPVRITVHNRIVVSRRYDDDDSPVDATFASSFPTVEGVFEIVRNALSNADHVAARYDGTLGYPYDVRIDYIANAVDDELTLEITGLRPL